MNRALAKKGFAVFAALAAGSLLSPIFSTAQDPAPVPPQPRATDAPAMVAPTSKQAPANSDGSKAGITWVAIPAGSYEMGTEEKGWEAAKPVHRVTLKPFELSKSQVTNKQYRACVDAKACTPAHFSDGTCWVFQGKDWKQGVLEEKYQKDDMPVVCIDWYQAKTFAEWVGGRLPSEAEWEYAARSGGKDQKFPWGDEKPTCERAVMDDGGNGCGTGGPAPVCSKPKGMTDQGLCDMAGSNWQWTQDWLHDSYDGAPTDGSAWEHPKGTMRVGRGGSWNDYAWLVQSHFRNAGYPIDRCAAGGVRVARTVTN